MVEAVALREHGERAGVGGHGYGPASSGCAEPRDQRKAASRLDRVQVVQGRVHAEQAGVAGG